MNNHLSKLFLVATTALAPWCSAGVIGDKVDLTAQFPAIGDILVDTGVKTIDGTIEYPEGTFGPAYSNFMSIQITDTQLIISFNELYGSFQTGAFNGLEVAFQTGTITGATADAASAFDPVAISIMNNDLFLNYQGVDTTFGQESIIDLTGGTSVSSTAPEPATSAILGSSLAVLVLLRRRLARLANPDCAGAGDPAR